MRGGDWERFIASLPVKFPLEGFVVRLRPREGGRVGVKVTPSSGLVPTPVYFNPDSPCALDQAGRRVESTTADEIREFLTFYIHSAVGAAVMTFGERHHFNEKRAHIVERAFGSWRKLNGARDKNGRLKQSMNCLAFVREGEYIRWCSNLTKDPSGLCRVHKKPDAKTSFNHGILEWVKALEEEERYDPVEAKRAELEAKRTARKEKWERVAAKIHYTATDPQMYLLLDLGAKPTELEGIDKRRASEMIDALLDAKYE